MSNILKNNSVNLLKFIIIVFTVFIVNYFINSWFINNDPKKLSQNINVLMLGDSQVIHDCNPSVIKHSVNIAQDGCPVIINYYLLKYITEHNPGISKVVFGISFNSFLKRSEDKFMKRNTAQQYMSIAYPFMKKDDFKNIDFLWSVYIEVIVRNLFIPNYYYWHNFIAGYFPSMKKKYPYDRYGYIPTNIVYNNWNDNAYFEKRAKYKFYGKDNEIRFGEKNNSYLDSCAGYCERNNIKLYIVLMPVEPRFTKYEPDTVKLYVKNKLEKIKDNYKSTEVLDYKNRYEGKEYFSDYLHLNEKGANTFSVELNKDVNIVTNKKQ
ncbi:MAG: hypothetical protein GXO47_05515 [Chlorobi bacterium]|nr:hypothetical protein [Chlorobiota bacterium]